MDINTIRRMTDTGLIYHHLDCRYGGSGEPEWVYSYNSGYIDCALRFNHITKDVAEILNDWNLKKLQAKQK